MQDLLYKIAITQIPSVGAITAKNLISYCGGAQAVFEASERDLLRIPGIGKQTAQKILQQDVLSTAERELEFLEQNNVRALFYLDEDYPDRLKQHSNAPVILFYKGTADLNHARVVGIVGTRKASPQGIANCEKIVEGLRQHNVLIISGLAYGIDITAHRKCVELGMETIGALGHGLGRIYPAAHRSVAKKMTTQGGLLSEYIHTKDPDAMHFPARNRIIAGLCHALVVVESAHKGGSMISADFAIDYKKELFAVPGRLQDKQSEGCNQLIKNHKAQLLESADDIIQAMNWGNSTPPIQRQLFLELTEAEQRLLDLIRAQDSIQIDRLTHLAQQTGSTLATTLLELELKGIIKALPGKRYMAV